MGTEKTGKAKLADSCLFLMNLMFSASVSYKSHTNSGKGIVYLMQRIRHVEFKIKET